MPWQLYWVLLGVPIVFAASLIVWLVLFPRMSGMVINAIREQPDAPTRQVWAELQVIHAVDQVAHGRHRLGLYLFELAGAVAAAITANHSWGHLLSWIELIGWLGWMWLATSSIKRRQWPERYDHSDQHYPGCNAP